MQLDHIVLGATTLLQGQQYIQEQLGIWVPDGGRHERFGTQNALMQLGGGVYFEIIAIEKGVTAQQTPRWYMLDSTDVQSSMAKQPCLLAWVVSTPSIDGLLLTQAINQGFNLGVKTSMHRGDLRWQMLIPPSGRHQSLYAPWILEWQNEAPYDALADMGCRLRSLEYFHPEPTRCESELRALGVASLIKIRKSANSDNKQQLKVTLTCHDKSATLEGMIID